MRVVLLVVLLSIVLVGCASPTQHSSPLPDPAPPDDISLRLDSTQARPGAILSMTIQGPGADAVIAGVAADFQHWDGQEWTTLYKLDLAESPNQEPRVVSVDQVHDYAFRLVGLGGSVAVRLKLPPVGPGEYRIARKIMRHPKSAKGREWLILYSRLVIVP
jgi:predicted component of type VI protein secretion system